MDLVDDAVFKEQQQVSAASEEGLFINIFGCVLTLVCNVGFEIVFEGIFLIDVTFLVGFLVALDNILDIPAHLVSGHFPCLSETLECSHQILVHLIHHLINLTFLEDRCLEVQEVLVPADVVLDLHYGFLEGVEQHGVLQTEQQQHFQLEHEDLALGDCAHHHPALSLEQEVACAYYVAFGDGGYWHLDLVVRDQHGFCHSLEEDEHVVESQLSDVFLVVALVDQNQVGAHRGHVHLERNILNHLGWQTLQVLELGQVLDEEELTLVSVVVHDAVDEVLLQIGEHSQDLNEELHLDARCHATLLGKDGLRSAAPINGRNFSENFSHGDRVIVSLHSVGRLEKELGVFVDVIARFQTLEP